MQIEDEFIYGIGKPDKDQLLAIQRLSEIHPTPMAAIPKSAVVLNKDSEGKTVVAVNLREIQNKVATIFSLPADDKKLKLEKEPESLDYLTKWGATVPTELARIHRSVAVYAGK